MNPQVRSGLLNGGSAIGGAIAAIGFMSQHGVDLYAMWNQINVVIAEVTKLIAMIVPFGTAAYAVYKASTKSKLADIVADPQAPAIAAKMPVTPETVAVANALKQG